MLDLTAGRYTTVHSPVKIASFLRTLASGISHATISDSTESTTMSGDIDIAFDEKMARLAMENAKTNAVSHGSGGPIEIGAKIQTQGKAFAYFLSTPALPTSRILSLPILLDFTPRRWR